jgi:uncharacterized phage protein (TIGR01671 family)
MREIKFRAWDKDDLCMRDWDNLLSHVYAKDKNTIFNDSDYEVMQFTGLHDKNGKEIYEGDIVKHFNGVQVVEWSEDSASFQMNLNDNVLDQEVSFDSQDVEVIGNIYENPELVGGTQKGLDSDG